MCCLYVSLSRQIGVGELQDLFFVDTWKEGLMDIITYENARKRNTSIAILRKKNRIYRSKDE